MIKDEKYCIALLNELATSTKTEIGPMMFRIYMQELGKHGWENCAMALEKCFLDLKRFPTIVEIQAKMGITQPDAKDEANALAGRILKACGQFGGYKAGEAREAIGEVAWEAIQRFGGWDALCMVEEDQLPTVRAQLRDMVKAVSAMDSVGRLNERPALNGGFDAMKFIEEAKRT